MALPLVRIIFGGLLLFFGRRIFWLFAAIAGFLFGIRLAGSLGFDWPAWLQLLAAIGLGLLMALLAVASVRVAGMIAGFLAGWVLVGELLGGLNVAAGGVNLVLLILGGVIGAVFALAVFDAAVIILSALAGAATVIGAAAPLLGLAANGPLMLILGAVLAVIGIIYQWRNLDHDRLVEGR